MLSSKITHVDKTALTTLNLKNWLVRKTISDAEILNLMQHPIMSHSKMWNRTQMNGSLRVSVWSQEKKKV